MRKSRVCYAISIGCFISVSIMAMLEQQPQPGGEVKHIDAPGNPAPSVQLVVISADWCGPCKVLSKTTVALVKEGYSIETKTDNSPNHAVPRLQWFRFGEVERTEYGALPKETLRAIFAEIEDKVFQ